MALTAEPRSDGVAAPDRLVPAVLFVAGIGGLGGALAGQHLFGLEPCVLCLWQRVPYALIAILGGLALIVPGARVRRALVAAAAVTLLAGAAVAFYHVGVEEHWWASGIPGCGGESVAFLEQPLTPEALQQRLAEAPPKPCDEVDWRLFGLSMAGYNTIASLVLAAATVAGLRRMRRGESA